MSVSGGPAGLVEAQREIAARFDRGASLADVRREIIDAASLDEEGRCALWLYAAARPETLRAARRFSPVSADRS